MDKHKDFLYAVKIYCEAHPDAAPLIAKLVIAGMITALKKDRKTNRKGGYEILPEAPGGREVRGDCPVSDTQG